MSGKEWLETVRIGSDFEEQTLQGREESVGKASMPKRTMVNIPISHLPKDWLPAIPRDEEAQEPSAVQFDPTPTVKKGRMDLFAILDDEGNDFAVIGEIKHTDWDRVNERNFAQRLQRFNRQVWKYVSAAQATDPDRPIYPAIIFARQPRSNGRLAVIERFFDENMVAVVWQNETVEERAIRGASGASLEVED